MKISLSLMHSRISFRAAILQVIGALIFGFSLQVQAAGTGYIFISSEKDNVVTVLDGASYELVSKIETSDRPRHMAFNADKSLIYVACGDGESIDIIDIAKLEVVDQIEEIEDPEAFDLSPDGKTMYISLEDDGALGVLDVASREMVAEIEVGEEPEGVLTGPDGKFVYVTSEVANAVQIVDTEAQELAATIIVGTRPRRFAMLPANDALWVTNELSGSVSVIDLASRTIKDTITFSPKGFRAEDITPVGIALTQDGKTAYVGLGRANHVAVLDVQSKEVRDYVLVGERAWNTTLTADESRLIVTNGLSDDISVIDTSNNKVVKSVPVGRIPYMALIDD